VVVFTIEPWEWPNVPPIAPALLDAMGTAAIHLAADAKGKIEHREKRLSEIQQGEAPKRKSKHQKPRGAPQVHDRDADAKLIAHWKAARRQGTTREAFARHHQITVKQLIHAQDRVRYHNGIGAE
jgi:hypothetical protein